MRRILLPLFRLVLRVFFRRVEVAGLERVASPGPVLVVVNHPNGFVDPIVLFALCPRPVSFLAKAPLFRMPVVGAIVRSLDSIPVFRQQDDPREVSKNRETFDRARELLSRGNAIGIFPEGISHDAPHLAPLKTGAARIALGARLANLRILPAGIFYPAKKTFRSPLLLSFGETIGVDALISEENSEPAPEAVRDLTRQIAEGLSRVTLQVERDEAVELIERAEAIFSAEEPGRPSLSDHLELRQRFAEGYSRLAERDPSRLEQIRARISRFEAELAASGLDVRDLTSSPYPPSAVIRWIFRRSVLLLGSIPFAAAGIVLHYPAYRLCGVVARRYSKEEDDLVATVKVFAAALFFPLTWIAAAILLSRFGFAASLAGLLGSPLLGWIALRFSEKLDRSVGQARAFFGLVFRRREIERLVETRRAIHSEIMELAELIGA